MDFSTLPHPTVLRNFVQVYMEERYKILKKPIVDLTEETIEKVFYWSMASYMVRGHP